jgi:electron transfer flavoprotein alpha subunit
MEKILVLAHTEADGSLNKAALEVVEAGRALTSGGGNLAAGLIGKVVRPPQGIATVYAVEGPEFGQARYATDAAAAEALWRAAGASMVLAPGTSRWMRALPGVAQRLNGRVDSHVMALEGGHATRWFYRQRIEVVLTRGERPWFLLLDAGLPYKEREGEPSVERVTVTLPPLRTRVRGLVAQKAEQQTIRPEADLLFVAGAGWTKKQRDGQTRVAEAGNLILEFLRHAGASLGSSKSLVDLSGEGQTVLPFLSHLNQVGQTGATPRHPKGLATCCHGEEPHVVGWRFIQERRAVNLDASCGWSRGKTDVLYVADAFEVIAKLNELLRA